MITFNPVKQSRVNASQTSKHSSNFRTTQPKFGGYQTQHSLSPEEKAIYETLKNDKEKEHYLSFSTPERRQRYINTLNDMRLAAPDMAKLVEHSQEDEHEEFVTQLNRTTQEFGFETVARYLLNSGKQLLEKLKNFAKDIVAHFNHAFTKLKEGIIDFLDEIFG